MGTTKPTNNEPLQILHRLSNKAYHFEQPYTDYLSSSQLKWYGNSPKYFRHKFDNPEEENSDALRFGSLFHDLMASCTEHYNNRPLAYLQWLDKIAVFTPPVNEKTGQAYGTATKAYKDAYETFVQACEGKLIASQAEVDTIFAIQESLLCDCGSTSEQVRKLLKWGSAEVSHFVEYEGCKFKFRPDLETKHKIVDWKTVNTDDLSERSINSIIAKYGYDISAAFYQFMEHEQSGEWKQFYWVFVSKQPPYDAVMVDASRWTYDYDPETDIAMPQVGAIKMKALLNLHIKCVKENHWPGAEIYIPKTDNGLHIMLPTPPAWEINNATNILEQNY